MNKFINFIKDKIGISTETRQSGRNHIIPRDSHSISRRHISENALKVLYRLHRSGYQAFLVGGAVRDLLLGREPKDFDIATDAKPEQVRRLFRNCRLIGRRFRLAHVYFHDEVIEVATFRAEGDSASESAAQGSDGMLLRDNIYGTLEDDVWRRDFACNALYYNIADFSIVDYVQGLQDIERNLLRIIGDPEARYREDPVRMLRAVRFTAKLGLTIEKKTAAPIAKLSSLLAPVSNARLFDETLKLFLYGFAASAFALLREHQLLSQILPKTAIVLSDPELHQQADALIMAALNNTDQRIAENKSVTPAFIYAAFLWYPMQQQALYYKDNGFEPHLAYEKAINDVLAEQQQRTAIPRRVSLAVREIWSLQQQLVRRHRRHCLKTLYQPRFRAAFDFLLICACAEPDLHELVQWWQKIQDADNKTRNKMLAELGPGRSRRKRRRPPRKKEG